MLSEEIDKPPKTIHEIGIHMYYMSKDIAELKKTMEEFPNGFASVKDLSAVIIRVGTLENKQNLKNTMLWVGLVASAIINIVVVYQLFIGAK